MNKYFLFLFALTFSIKCFALEKLQTNPTKSAVKIINEYPLYKTLHTSSQLRIENINNTDYHNKKTSDEYQNSTAKINFISNLLLDQKWFAEINFRAEQVDKQSYSKKNYEGEGAYLREARFGYNDRNMMLFVGKFRPFFGIAWRNGRNNWMDYTANNLEQFDYNNTRGLWSDFVANNYAQTEKIGGGAVVKSGNAKTIGKYELGLSFFTNDRKNFDNSIINKRTSATKQDALAGDTRSLKSYVASLDVSFDFAPEEKLFYRFSYIDLAVNSLASSVDSSRIADQKGFSAAINYQYPFSTDFNLNGLAEYVKMKNIGGDSNISDNYTNASLVANIFRNWNITTAYGERKNTNFGQNGFDQNMLEFSTGYRFDKNKYFDSLLIQIGYRNLQTDYHINLDKKNTLGILLRYIKNF